ncbi:uncharacterized protein LOC141690732 [Apium graveolens]|uniref:uncharacterized protein LOC141690732 n=1 Tax=Apium graveolens TaxID=4045 RepID=UPI003D7967D0
MDRSWLKADRRTQEFKLGVDELLNFAFLNGFKQNKISCPCLRCAHSKSWNAQTVKDHLYQYGIDQTYTCWIWHGESNYVQSHVVSEQESSVDPTNMRMGQDIIDDEDISLDSSDFMNHVQGENEPLYPGCESFTKMRALVKLYNLKAKHGISDKCFSDVLLLLASMLPEGNSMPSSFGEAKKTLCTLGMDYEKIHVCPNDCLLYRGERDEDETICRICGESRWKLNKKGEELEGIPAKVLWWPEFAAEARNLRLALSSDGFNPFHGPGSDHSTWPVLLSIYNLPPWLCMKRKYIMLSLLISGPNQPGNDIDVYLQPLIEDLQKLWHGKQVYDAFKKESFILRGILLWTISDYPALGNLSGNIIKGYNACVVCVDKTKATRLATYKKTVVMRHRRWLPRNHPYRRQKSAFDNTMEKLSEPIPLTGEEVLERVLPLADHVYGKTQNQPRWKKGEPRPIWKKMSIFFQLEYWKFLPVRHTLDVMHIEKNICEALTGTLLNIPGKTKDRESVRIDMAEMGIRMELRPKNSGKKEKLPMASWNLLHREKKIVCSSLIGMKLPDGFCSNLKGIVSMDTLRLVGMKSHDCHTMLHHLLPIALRSVLQKQVRCTIIRFCLFFKAICSKIIEVDKLEKMQSQLVETLCQLEKHFPPSLFDVMIHLSVHLVREVELCGPIFLRWMYPFERYMKTFKGYVRNRAHPEGCIAEAYIAEEAVECLVNFEEPTVGLPGRDKNKEKYRPLSGATMIKPSIKDLHQAHLCLLQNSNELTPYFNEHMAFLVARYPLHENDEEWLKNKQNETFPNWFQKKISSELLDVKSMVSKEVMWLAEGPNKYVPTFSGYKVNGVTYSTKDRDDTRQVQCSGVCVHADTMLVQDKDKNIEHISHTFYGVITSIWELDYNHFRVPIFRCNWVDMNKGVKIDDLGYTVVNLHKLGFLNDPFVLGKHVKQVCYIDDPLEKFWSVVLKLPNKFDDQSDDENEGSVEIELENEVDVTMFPTVDEVEEENRSYMREEEEMIQLP